MILPAKTVRLSITYAIKTAVAQLRASVNALQTEGKSIHRQDTHKPLRHKLAIPRSRPLKLGIPKFFLPKRVTPKQLHLKQNIPKPLLHKQVAPKPPLAIPNPTLLKVLLHSHGGMKNEAFKNVPLGKKRQMPLYMTVIDIQQKRLFIVRSTARWF
jgi:hypothetical protein